MPNVRVKTENSRHSFNKTTAITTNRPADFYSFGRSKINTFLRDTTHICTNKKVTFLYAYFNQFSLLRHHAFLTFCLRSHSTKVYEVHNKTEFEPYAN